ncbi:metal ABC transporter ATP-binding protein [Actinoplanes sp. NPDC051859]|uniref:metal ABC transporter ATP-binding protein n=1 Tax=Actinoplanes sp. NPDC051859 TaxID=3363909 RepID=UPI003789A0E9
MTPTRDGEPLIRIADATVSYDKHAVLTDIDMTLHAGAFVGVVGPSGSGKTSLLRLILGSLRPRHGTVTRRPGLATAYVPQLETVNWNFPITVGECVLMARTRRTLPWPTRAERADVAHTLERLGIGDLAHRHIRDLSGGQQQRMFLARALLRRPQLLLLDEPTSGVDITTRHDMLHLLADINTDGVAILLTTHDLNGVAAHLPQLVALNRTILAAGSAHQVITAPVLEATFGAPMHVMKHLGMPVVLDAHPPARHTPNRLAA